MMTSLWRATCFFVSRPIQIVRASSASAVQQPTSKEFSFTDHRTAYAHLSHGEVLRAWFVLKLCSLDFLVQNSLKLLEHSERALGRKLLEKILRPTLYDQFVAGDDPRSLEKTAAKLKQVGIRLMVLPSMEEDVGENENQLNSKYDTNTDITLQLARVVADHGGPLSCLQTKITALINANLMLKIAEQNRDKENMYRTVTSWANYLSGGAFQSAPYLTVEENIQLEKGLERMKRVGESASKLQLRLLVDGEYTYLNRAISIAALSMAGAFNQSRPVIWNTYQCYLKEAPDKIRSEIEVAHRMGVCFGAKIVRGAYLDRERQLSVEGNYPDPTNPSYEATSTVYDSVVEYMLQQVKECGNRCNVIVASHNESSVLKAVKKMASLGIQASENTVVFGQIYGMAFNITVKLAAEGFVVYNSVPYGSIFDVLPYLSRRATENKAVLKGTRRERALLTQELRSRFLGF